MVGRTNPYDIESVGGYPKALQIYRIAACWARGMHISGSPGAFASSAKLDQSDQGYNRAEQVIVDGRYWHFSDIPPALTNVRYRG